MIKNYLLTTISALRQNPLYTALSVFGTALTFVFVSVLFLLVEATKGNYIPPKFTERTWHVQSISYENNSRRNLKTDEANIWTSKMTTPESITKIGNGSETQILNSQSISFIVHGVSDNYFDVFRLKFLHGRPINRQEITDNIPVAVLDRNTANIYFGKNEEAIGKTIEIYTIQHIVVGVVENPSFLSSMTIGLFAANVFVPLNDKNFSNCVILFTGKDKNSVAEMQAEFTRALDETNTAEGTQYRIDERGKSSVKERTSGITGIGGLLVSLILMLIPAVNILSLNVTKSFERSEEIAIRKTFGAPVSAIFGQLFFENLLLTLAGAIVGMCVTPMLMNGIDKIMLEFSIIPMALSLHFNWKTILIVAMPCVLLFSFLSGSVPAYITAKRQIVNVLKGEAQ